MKKITGIDFQTPQGLKHGDILIYSRFGSKSPELWIIVSEGKRITPFEMKVRGYKLTLNSFFKVVYRESIKNLIPHDNPLFKTIPKMY